MNVGCVVKAAGKSTRFGGSKLLAPLGGRPVLVHVLENIPKTRFARLTVVVSDGKVAALCRDCGIEPLAYGGGPVSETVRIGLSAMDGMDGCMFVSGDQPLCQRVSYGRMLDAFTEAPEQIVRLSWRGQPGSPVLFPKHIFPRLAGLAGEKGGMAAVTDEDVVRLVEAEHEAELWDADTPAALAALEKAAIK